MTITLPYPPSSNVYYRMARGKIIVSPEAREYRRNVALRAKVSRIRKLDGHVWLYLHVYRPRRAGDVSNRIKIVEDALNGIAYDDDEQVVQLTALRFLSPKNPRIEVSVYPVNCQGSRCSHCQPEEVKDERSA